jgi:ABC-type multidrug transport system fused ATPase/permease subunit
LRNYNGKDRIREAREQALKDFTDDVKVLKNKN